MDDSALLEADDVAPFLQPRHRILYPTDSKAQAARPALLAAIRRLQAGVRRYHGAGVVIGVGTDQPFPVAIHHELEALVESGLSPADRSLSA